VKSAELVASAAAMRETSGWVYALTAGHAHTVTMWPEQGQVELFGDGDFRCLFSSLPAQAVSEPAGVAVGIAQGAIGHYIEIL
jgi:hypothetical protein